MSKFKVGDRVRLIKQDSCRVPVGTTAILIDERSNGYWIMQLDNGKEPSGHTQSEKDFELVSPGLQGYQFDTIITDEINNNEEDTMSIQNDIINQNLSDNQEYLLRKGVIDPAGGVASLATLLQVLLALNEDAVVKYMKEAEAKAADRLAGLVDEVTPTTGN